MLGGGGESHRSRERERERSWLKTKRKQLGSSKEKRPKRGSRELELVGGFSHSEHSLMN